MSIDVKKAELIEDVMTVIKANKDEEHVSAFQLADMIKETVDKAENRMLSEQLTWLQLPNE